MKSPLFDLSERNLHDMYNSTLHYLVQRNHSRTLLDLLRKFTSDESLGVNTKNHKKKTALHIACENQFDKCALALLAAGADPNQRDSNKNTPLHLICKVGNYEFIPKFLDTCMFDLDLTSKDY